MVNKSKRRKSTSEVFEADTEEDEDGGDEARHGIVLVI